MLNGNSQGPHFGCNVEPAISPKNFLLCQTWRLDVCALSRMFDRCKPYVIPRGKCQNRFRETHSRHCRCFSATKIIGSGRPCRNAPFFWKHAHRAFERCSLFVTPTFFAFFCHAFSQRTPGVLGKGPHIFASLLSCSGPAPSCLGTIKAGRYSCNRGVGVD